MYYRLLPEIQEIDVSEIDDAVLTAGYIDADELEEMVALGKADKELSVHIYEQKKQLLILRGYYEQLIDLGEALEENENDIFESDSLHYFALLTATLDYRLNHIMEIFTIISGCFCRCRCLWAGTG